MTTTSNGREGSVNLPDLPMGNPIGQSAQRARSLPSPAADVTEGDRKRLPRWTVPAVSGVLSGGSVLAAQPKSLAQVWERHAQSARHYQAFWMRWPRYAWGGLHTALVAVLRTVEWVTDSPPKLLTAAAVVAACWYWS